MKRIDRCAYGFAREPSESLSCPLLCPPRTEHIEIFTIEMHTVLHALIMDIDPPLPSSAIGPSTPPNMSISIA